MLTILLYKKLPKTETYNARPKVENRQTSMRTSVRLKHVNPLRSFQIAVRPSVEPLMLIGKLQCNFNFKS